MISLHFKAAPYFLAYYPLTAYRADYFTDGKFDELVVQYQHIAKAFNSQAYDFVSEDLRFSSDRYFSDASFKEHELSKQCAKVDEMLEKMQSEACYKELLEQTNKALVACRHNWEESLPRMQTYANRISPPTVNQEINVFVTQPSLTQHGTFFGDIYMTDMKSENSNYLWSAVTDLVVQRALGDAETIDQQWVQRLIKSLFNEELSELLHSKNQNKEDENDKIFVRDKNTLRPKFKQFLNTDPHQSLAEFNQKAFEFMMQQWNTK
jgi:hypothetical protein